MRSPRQRGSVLVGVLWCLVLLAVVVVGVLHQARLGLFIARHHGDEVQARYLAIAGIEKAKALLALDARDRRRAGRAHSSELFNAPGLFKDIVLGPGRFSVLRPGTPAEGGGWIHGVADEEGRLNINVAGTNELLRLPGMTQDAAAAIVDWRDNDNTVSAGGAEAGHYASLNPPYLPRNGPFQTPRELLMVRGISPQMLLGRQSFRQGGSASADLRDGGWRDVITVRSGVANLSHSGQGRVNLQSADERALSGVRGFTPDIARAIVARRGNNRFESVLDLLELTAAQPAGPIGPGGSIGSPRFNPANASNPGGPRLVGEELLLQVADDLTTDDRDLLEGAINVNSAGIEVLMCLPGIDRTLAQAIVNSRNSSGPFANTVALLRVPGLTRDLLRPILPRLTTRSETFRILAEGIVPSRDTRRRIEVVVQIGARDITTLAWREDDL